MKKFMFVNRKAPYGTIYSLESLEVVLITATFDQDVSLAFVDDGVYELVKGQDTKAIGIKNHSKTYRALDGYDVEKLYVERESMEARGLTEADLLVDVEVLSSAEMADLMAGLVEQGGGMRQVVSRQLDRRCRRWSDPASSHCRRRGNCPIRRWSDQAIRRPQPCFRSCLNRRQ